MARSVCIWHVSLSDENWYDVFARDAKEAERIVRTIHYPDLNWREFRKEMKPKVTIVDPDRKMSVCHEGVGCLTKTAREWVRGEEPGPFTSNTYEG